jgi:hypothetical protein
VTVKRAEERPRLSRRRNLTKVVVAVPRDLSFTMVYYLSSAR